MKTIALTLFAAALGFGQSSTPAATTPATTPAPKAAPKSTSTAPDKKPAQPSKPSPDQKAKAQSQTQSIPAGAILVEPNLYRYTDSSGKTWNYRRTPFGVSKWEETAAPASQSNPQATPAQSEAKPEPVAVTDLGDSYRFERKTPFGASTWVRKKSELTDEEKVLAGGQQAQSDSKQSANSKPAGNQ
jgi:hypothetical protein